MYVIDGVVLERDWRDDPWVTVSSVGDRLNASPLLLGMLRSIAGTTGLPSEPSLSIFGQAWTRPFDILFTQSNCLLLLINGYHGAHLWELRDHRTASLLPAGTGESLAQTDWIRRRLSVHELNEERFNHLKPKDTSSRPPAETLEWTSPQMEPHKVAAANALIDPEVRRLLVKLRKSAMLIADVDAHSASVLESMGLAERAFQIACKKTSRTITTVGSVADMKRRHWKCVCGRFYEEETIASVLVATDESSLMENSRWMQIWLTDRASSRGFPTSSVGWNSKHGNDELDLCLHAFGAEAFVELKDRPFGLGDLYKFLVRLDRYGGTCGIVCTTGDADDTVREFVANNRRYPPLVLVEQVDTNPGRFDDAIAEFQMISFIKLLDEIAKVRGVSFPVGHAFSLWHRQRTPDHGFNRQAGRSD